jgi:hypothetical protein
MTHLNFHPAPGIGELLPGWWSVPQNPIVPRRYQPSIGELLPGRFTIPQNPIKATLRMGVNNAAMGCVGCAAQDRYLSQQGLGGLGMFNSYNPFDATNPWGITEWAIAGGGLLLVLMMLRPGQSAYKAAVSTAKQQYREAVTRARAKYPRVAGRIKRAAAAL